MEENTKENLPKTVQLSVLKRFMNDEILAEFMKSYRGILKNSHMRDRTEWLSRPVEENRFKALVSYLTQPEKTVTEISKETGVNYTEVRKLVAYSAIQLLYKYPEALKMIQEGIEKSKTQAV